MLLLVAEAEVWRLEAGEKKMKSFSKGKTTPSLSISTTSYIKITKCSVANINGKRE